LIAKHDPKKECRQDERIKSPTYKHEQVSVLKKAVPLASS